MIENFTTLRELLEEPNTFDYEIKLVPMKKCLGDINHIPGVIRINSIACLQERIKPLIHECLHIEYSDKNELEIEFLTQECYTALPKEALIVLATIVEATREELEQLFGIESILSD